MAAMLVLLLSSFGHAEKVNKAWDARRQVTASGDLEIVAKTDFETKQQEPERCKDSVSMREFNKLKQAHEKLKKAYKEAYEIHQATQQKVLKLEEKVTKLSSQLAKRHHSGLSAKFGRKAGKKQLYDRNKWAKQRFIEFSAQCSHNTYLWGRQSSLSSGFQQVGCVDPRTMQVALNLGYRCIEIDVWWRNNVKPPGWAGPYGNDTEKSLVKVTHSTAFKQLTNDADLSLFVQQIIEWCENDERQQEGYPKLPIIISIENNVRTQEQEDYVGKVFGWLGSRIVYPGEFNQTTLMKTLAVDKGMRKIILKGGIHFDSALKPIVAMTKKLVASVTMAMYTVDVQAIAKKRLDTDAPFIRTYPHQLSTSSVNYSPGSAFKAGVQMVCINFQGRCKTPKDICSAPIRAKAGKNIVVISSREKGVCSCERDVAIELEAAFETYGYDGYILLDGLSVDAMEALMNIRLDDSSSHDRKEKRVSWLPQLGPLSDDMQGDASA
eukprot:gnl/MRDRNA2_/MRDRNA2_73352_c0_seq1.p1 gnl/MRDRNA2_/MRDRNA2_73352_c0~~gnl/MRDRNA2_/MRDRNA2_73352_c0_seq1.p1  ORF type:complete len:530 (-),score=106.28 gnl/MRDRNA2_/MRDRNA2_73352_c0_seq1:20-1498(-)